MENARENFNKKIPKDDKKKIKMLNLLTSMHPFYVPMSFSYRLENVVFFFHI